MKAAAQTNQRLELSDSIKGGMLLELPGRMGVKLHWGGWP